MNVSKSGISINVFRTAYDNDIDAFIPQHWAMETLALLVENMKAALLVHRDFEDEFEQFGNTVNTRKPADFVAKRKGVNDDVIVQNAEAENIPVVLDHHVYVSFVIKDGEESMSMVSLIDTYLKPAAIALARNADKVVLGQYPHYSANQATVGALSTSNAAAAVTTVRNVQNKAKCPMEGRNLIVTPDTETYFLQNSVFHEADKVGDEGTALREASLGRKFGYDIFMCQNMASVPDDAAGTGAATLNSGNLTKGSTTLTVTSAAANELLAGMWIKIDGAFYHVLTDNDGGGGATSITVSPGLVKNASSSTAAIVIYPTTTVDQAVSPTGYAAGYQKEIEIDAATAGVQVVAGRIVSFGESEVVYTIIEATSATSFMLDRPLEAAVADGAAVNFGPTGEFNFAFNRNAMTLAIRPLKPPRTGALAAVASYGGATVRVVITYEGRGQGHLVTLDFLAGVKVLDEDLGAVLYAPAV